MSKLSENIAILFCPIAQKCWGLSALNVNFSPGLSLPETIREVIENKSIKEIEMFCSIA